MKFDGICININTNKVFKYKKLENSKVYIKFITLKKTKNLGIFREELFNKLFKIVEI